MRSITQRGLLRTALAGVLASGFALGACGEFGGDDASEVPRPGGFDAGNSVDAGGDTGGGAGGRDSGSEPEEEADFRLQPPAASRSYVYVANTTLNAVARIDSLTLQIRTIEVGFEPTIVRTTPAGDRAIVLNEGSHDVSIVAEGGGVVDTVPVTPGANSLVLSPRGDYAVAWYDDRIAQRGDEAGSLSDASVVRIEGGEVFNLVVGVHIRDVVFDEGGETAFFVTDDGVAVVALAALDGDRFVPPVRVSDDVDAALDARDREVSIVATGEAAFALVRLSTSTEVTLVDLDAGSLHPLELGAVPTDLDVAEDGASALLVLRERSEVVRLAIPGAFTGDDEPERFAVGEEAVGLAQAIPGTSLLALYSTVDENDHLTLLDLGDGSFETYALRKGVESLRVSPDATRLLVIHTKRPGQAVPGTDTFLERSWAYTVFNLESRTSRLVITETRPGDLAFSADGTSAFLLLADEAQGIRAVEWANLVTGRDETIELRRLPQSIGVIPATGRIYVSEEHEVGRMGFIDPETGDLREVTGYHLNSRTE
jgi:hypothetical protein